MLITVLNRDLDVDYTQFDMHGQVTSQLFTVPMNIILCLHGLLSCWSIWYYDATVKDINDNKFYGRARRCWVPPACEQPCAMHRTTMGFLDVGLIVRY